MPEPNLQDLRDTATPIVSHDQFDLDDDRADDGMRMRRFERALLAEEFLE